jgi:hypothetical protein
VSPAQPQRLPADSQGVASDVGASVAHDAQDKRSNAEKREQQWRNEDLGVGLGLDVRRNGANEVRDQPDGCGDAERGDVQPGEKSDTSSNLGKRKTRQPGSGHPKTGKAFDDLGCLVNLPIAEPMAARASRAETTTVIANM